MPGEGIICVEKVITMCGIFGYIGKKTNAPEMVLEGLKTLEYRGYDSWGVATIGKTDGSKIIVKKRVGKIGDATVADMPSGSIAFGHTRWATHGGVTEVNAHPHRDCTGSLAIIHNGIVENYDELKRELKKKNHRFVSETDTEVVVHLIEEAYAHNQSFTEAVRLSFNRLEGMNAIIVMDAKTETVIAVKNGSPLTIGKGAGENFLASDSHAMLPYTKNIYFMEDGDLAVVGPDDVSVYDVQTGNKKAVEFTTVSWGVLAHANKKHYAHFMLKEINDQPVVMDAIVKNKRQEIEKFSEHIKASFGTYFVGCGTAAYACLAGTYIFSKIAKRHVNFSVASEFGYLVDFLRKDSFVVGLSQSGETIDLIDAVKKAKKRGATVGALVNVIGSTLYRFADHPLLLEAGVETAVVSTKAFTAKLTYLILSAYSLIDSFSQGQELLESAIAESHRLMGEAHTGKIRALAEEMKDRQHIYVVGRGVSYPVALETALKIKEASYIHAEGFAAGELKHGVIALIEPGTPCIVFLPDDETYAATLAGAMEMKARGAVIYGISYKPHDVFDRFIEVKDCGIASMIPMAIAGQLMGYFLAVLRGYDPDKPRNLAKSVTVK